MERDFKFIKYVIYEHLKRLYFNIFPNKYVNGGKNIKCVYFELSSKCNLKCPFCTHRFNKRNGEHMSYDRAVDLFNKLPTTLKYAYLHFSGEPFLNPDISSITKYLSEKGIFTIASTNGTLPARRYIETLEYGLKKLIFTIDGATPETHERYRKGSNFNEVMKTFSEVLSKKPKDSRVGVHCLVTKFNENEIGRMTDMLKQLGPDFFILKPLSLNIGSNDRLESESEKLRNAQEFLPNNKKFMRYHFNGKELKLKYPRIVCPFIYIPAIGADGEICLCTEDIDRQIKIGNLNDYASFEELWQTKRYQKIRKDVLNKELPICKNCNYNFYEVEKIKLNRF